MTDSATPAPSVLVTDSVPSTTDTAEALDQDAQQLVDGINDELATNPPFSCPMTYHGPGNQGMAERGSYLLKVHALLLRRRHPWLSFEALDSIVFHSDYAQALRDLSERAGRVCKATDEPFGVGLAMAVKLGEKSAVVLDAGILHGIAGEEDSKQDICVDTALHELCHVYDNARKQRLLAEDMRRGTVKPLQGHVFTAADAAWSEYFANKYSDSGCSSLEAHPQMLADVVPALVSDMRQAIIAYRTNNQIDALLALCRQKVHFLFQCFGYAAGRLSANSKGLDDVAPESATVLRTAGLWDIWQRTFAALDQLDDVREAWTSYDDLQPLMDQADATFKVLGLNYRLNDSGGVRVDIPYTPETMPNTPEAQFLAALAARGSR